MKVWTISPFIRQTAFIRLAVGIVALAVIAWAAYAAGSEDPAQDTTSILRFDPLHRLRGGPDRGILAPISEQELRVGCVYNHYSARLNRRVWAIWRTGGFWHALGEGTTQSAPALDVDIPKISQEEREKLTKEHRDLLKKLEREPGSVFCSLDKNNMWKLDPTAGHATVYDAETQYRWEWAYNRYLPTSSAPFVFRWLVVDGQYVPVAAPPSAAGSIHQFAPAEDIDCPFPILPSGAVRHHGCPCSN